MKRAWSLCIVMFTVSCGTSQFGSESSKSDANAKNPAVASEKANASKPSNAVDEGKSSKEDNEVDNAVGLEKPGLGCEKFEFVVEGPELEKAANKVVNDIFSPLLSKDVAFSMGSEEFRRGFRDGEFSYLIHLFGQGSKSWKVDMHLEDTSLVVPYKDESRYKDLGSKALEASSLKKSGEATVLPLIDFISKDMATYLESEESTLKIKISALDENSEQVGSSCEVVIALLSPIVLDFSGASNLVTQSVLQSKASFDLNADGRMLKSGWIMPESQAFLALDLNGDGLINDGGELFGTATKSSSGTPFKNGYLALSAYDDNGDQVLDGKDKVYSQLRLWFDQNGNGKSESSEIYSLADKNVTSMSLNYQIQSPQMRFADGLLANDVRFKATFFGPSQCPKSGCSSYDVFFRTMADSLAHR